jgi:DNA-binding MarR family transcriptional regulator
MKLKFPQGESVTNKPTPRKSTPRLSETDYARLAEFRYLLRRFVVFSEGAAADAKLTAQQHQALLAIKGFGASPPTTGDLAERLCVKHHSAVGLVDRLVKKGLVRRDSNPADGRQVLLGLSPAAEKLLARLSVAHKKELRQLAPLLTALLAHFEGKTRTRQTRR